MRETSNPSAKEDLDVYSNLPKANEGVIMTDRKKNNRDLNSSQDSSRFGKTTSFLQQLEEVSKMKSQMMRNKYETIPNKERMKEVPSLRS